MNQVHQLVLGAAAGHGLLEGAEPPVEVEVLDLVEIGLVGAALLGPVGVDVGVGEDAVQPRPQVGALLEAAEAAVGPQVGLLHEVLGVGRVAGHPERGRVQRRHVLHGLLGEVGLVGHAATLTPAPLCLRGRRRHRALRTCTSVRL